MMFRSAAVTSVVVVGMGLGWGCSTFSGDDPAPASTLDEAGAGASDGGDTSAAPPVMGKPPPGCDVSAELKDSPVCIDDGLGVFVSPTGDDVATGTKLKPVKTIGKALELVVVRKLPRIYVCTGTYAENVAITAQVAIYGGVSCEWAATGARPKIAPPKGIALSVTKVAAAVLVVDADVVGSADAATPGDSAIAAFVSESTNVAFRRVNLTAGKATAGAKGASSSNYVGAAAPDGAPGAIAGTNETKWICANKMTASYCVAGAPATDVGSGESGYALPAVGLNNGGASGFFTCAAGQVGAGGLSHAAGGASTSPGTLSAAGWVTTSVGTAGGVGDPAQGGGGGGGQKDGQYGGGGGGCGGCGGAGGGPGTNGGSSFALLSFNASVAIDGGVLTSGVAGPGGPGGDGQVGQAGGKGGLSSSGVSNLGCTGGAGGPGAGGSGGGGGAGGHSAAIGFVGSEPKPTGAMLTPGSPGLGGAGGEAGPSSGHPGVAGLFGAVGKSQGSLGL